MARTLEALWASPPVVRHEISRMERPNLNLKLLILFFLFGFGFGSDFGFACADVYITKSLFLHPEE